MKKRISKKDYERVCSRLSRLRTQGEGYGELVNTGIESDRPEGQTSEEISAAGKVPASTPEIIPSPSLSFVAAATTQQSSMNGHEQKRFKYLKCMAYPYLRDHALTFLLGHDCRYTPDFSYVDENGFYTFEEVKGFRREDAMVKLRVVARAFREFRFKLVSYNKNTHDWSVKEVKP